MFISELNADAYYCPMAMGRKGHDRCVGDVCMAWRKRKPDYKYLAADGDLSEADREVGFVFDRVAIEGDYREYVYKREYPGIGYCGMADR